MWIRTNTGKLLNLRHVIFFQYGGYKSESGDVEAILFDGHEITVQKVATRNEADATLDKIHQWLSRDGYLPTKEVYHMWPIKPIGGYKTRVLDLRDNPAEGGEE